MNKQNRLFHNDNPTLPPLAKGRIKEGSLHNDNKGYVLIITLLSLVALTIAGMGAMMVASSDINLSGNQRTQLSTKSVANLGVSAGMGNLCSNSFLTAAYYTGPTKVINIPSSQPQTAFYQGIYSTAIPTSTPAAGTFDVGYYAANAPAASLPQMQSIGNGGGNVANKWYTGGGSGVGGGFYLIGPMIGLMGSSTKMECQQAVYYGVP